MERNEDAEGLTREFGVVEFVRQFGQIVDDYVLSRGETLRITRRGRPILEVRPIRSIPGRNPVEVAK